MKVLVTGANGFIGRALVSTLDEHGYEIIPVVRSAAYSGTVPIGDVGPETDWTVLLTDVDSVIHTAARAHVVNEKAAVPLAKFRYINVEGTLNLARQAAAAGIRRFIFISSIGVNGNLNTHPFTEQDAPQPHENYAISKLEAEQALQRLSEESKMEIVIIRPPLVYGPNVPGNFRSLLRWVTRGIPLPFGSIHNKRSLVTLDNLVDLIETCIVHPAAANQVFLVSDGEDLSTTDLLRRTATALSKPARLLPVPQSLLELGLNMLGKSDVARRLCGSLQVDISKAREVLDWSPPVSVDEGLRKTAKAYLKSK